MQSHLQPNDTRDQFLLVEKYCKNLGLDIGCGTNRFSPTVLTIDWYDHVDTDMIWNCAPEPKEGEQQYVYPYPFRENRFDFVFASHILEDFLPSVIQWVFDEWLRLIKVGGYLVILVPDMENHRYPDWDEKFTEDDEEVKRGERKVNELKGNPSHRICMGLTLLHKLKNESQYKTEIVQEDTFTHDRMTLDFILKKL
jgi:predicted SAM-dependent methyltransferase